MDFCVQMLDQQISYQLVNQVGRAASTFLEALSTGTKVLDLRPAILAIKVSPSDLCISIFTT